MEFQFANRMNGLKPSAIREIFKSLQDPSVISFAAGNPSPQSFPMEEIAAISAEIFADKKSAVNALQYSITEGYGPLLEKVTSRLKTKFFIGAGYDSTIITSGGQQAIDLCCKVLCNEGDTIICENPSFIGSLNSFRAHGARLVGVDLEKDGANIEQIETELIANKRVKMIYLIPTFQNPGGTAMSKEKRKAVYRLAQKYDVVIFEDNPYGELRYEGEELAAIKSLDTDGRVVYCGSFSKILSPGIRVGFVCAHGELIQKIIVAKQVNDVHTNILAQMICDRFIAKYDLDAQIEKIRALYRTKCRLMLEQLDKAFAGRLDYTRPQGGIFMWCTLPKKIDMRVFVARALEKKVAVVPGSAFMCDQDEVSHGFRLNFSMPNDEQIIEGVGLLRQVFDEF